MYNGDEAASSPTSENTQRSVADRAAQVARDAADRRSTDAAPICFGTIAPRVVDNGWPAVIPLNGKKAFTEDWSRYNHQLLDDDQLIDWCRRYPRHNVGLPVPATITVVDTDILDPVLARAVEQIRERILGPTPMVRIGRTPKTMAFYRGSGICSRRAHPIEIFNGSGQVVIYGIHPDTGQPYFWPDEEPLSTSPDELPDITASDVDRFLAAALAAINQASLSAPARTGFVNDPDFFRRLRAERAQKTGTAWRDELARQLREAAPGTFHNTAISVVGALVCRGYSDRAIRSFVDDNFSAPRVGEYAVVWDQIDVALRGARRRWGIQPTAVRLVDGAQ